MAGRQGKIREHGTATAKHGKLRIWALICAALLLAASFAGCGPGPEQAAGNSTTAAGVTTAPPASDGTAATAATAGDTAATEATTASGAARQADGTSAAGAAAGQTVDNTPVTMSMLIARDATVINLESHWFWGRMTELKGISWDFDVVDRAAWEERKNLEMMSGTLHDVIIGGMNINEQTRYGASGLLVNIKDYPDSLKNLYAMEQNDIPGLVSHVTCPDGKAYTFPAINNVIPGSMVTPRIWLNVDWAAEAGYGEPETMDDLYNILTAYKARGDSVIPLSSAAGNSFEGYFLNAFGFTPINPTAAGVTTTTSRLTPDAGGKWTYAPVHPDYPVYLAFMNKLYTEGLMDPEWLTLEAASLNAKGAQMLIGIAASPAHHIFATTDEAKWGQYEALKPVSTELNPSGEYFATNYINGGAVVIASSCPYPARAVDYFDYVYSDEGNLDFYFGPAYGTDPSLETGWQWADDAQEHWDFVNMPDEHNWWSWMQCYISPGFGLGMRPSEFEMKWNFPSMDYSLRNSNSSRYKPKLTKNAYPNIYMLEDETAYLNIATTELETFVRAEEVNFIIGARALDTFDDFVSDVKNMEVDKIVGMYQAAYDRQMQ